MCTYETHTNEIHRVGVMLIRPRWKYGKITTTPEKMGGIYQKNFKNVPRKSSIVWETRKWRIKIKPRQLKFPSPTSKRKAHQTKFNRLYYVASGLCLKYVDHLVVIAIITKYIFACKHPDIISHLLFNNESGSKNIKLSNLSSWHNLQNFSLPWLVLTSPYYVPTYFR